MQVVEARAHSAAPREEVTIFEPPARFGYKLLSGLSLRDYHAKIPLSGGLLRRALQKFIQDAAERLAREAERTTTSN